MAGTRIPAGENRKNGSGGFTNEGSDKKTSPKEKLKASEVKFGSFIDKRAGK